MAMNLVLGVHIVNIQRNFTTNFAFAFFFFFFFFFFLVAACKSIEVLLLAKPLAGASV